MHTVYIACQRHLGESPGALPMFLECDWIRSIWGLHVIVCGAPFGAPFLSLQCVGESVVVVLARVVVVKLILRVEVIACPLT